MLILILVSIFLINKTKNKKNRINKYNKITFVFYQKKYLIRLMR